MGSSKLRVYCMLKSLNIYNFVAIKTLDLDPSLFVKKQGSLHFVLLLYVDDIIIFRYSSVSLSLTLDRNEKIEQHIRKKTHKPISNALRFWVEGGVISLCVVWLSSHSCEISPVCPLGFSQQVVSERLVYGLDEYSLTLYRKSSWWRFQASMSRISVWTAVQVRGHE